jgi:hypothetical protein
VTKALLSTRGENEGKRFEASPMSARILCVQKNDSEHWSGRPRNEKRFPLEHILSFFVVS